MKDMLVKIIFLTLIYGTIGIIAGKGASGDIVRFVCAIGMLVFITGAAGDMSIDDVLFEQDEDVIRQSAEAGEKLLVSETNEQIEKIIEEDIENICREFGENLKVQVEIENDGGKIDVERIIIEGIIKDEQNIGFAKDEIIDKYDAGKVEIIGN